MAKVFQPSVNEAINLIWRQYDPVSAQKGQERLYQAAVAGDADAWGLLARSYMGAEDGAVWETSGLAADEAKANECLQGSIRGGSGLGVLCAIAHRGLYPSELELVRSRWETMEDVLEAAQEYADEAMGAYLFGICYLENAIFGLLDNWEDDSRETRVKLAVPYLEKSLSLGLAIGLNAYWACADFLYEQMGDSGTQAKAAEFEQRFCEAGMPQMLFHRGKRYFLEMEFQKARECFEQAAANGYQKANYWLGYTWRHGLGVVEDLQQAVDYLVPLAENGYVPAMGQLAEIDFWQAKDYAAAFQWCMKMLDAIADEARRQPSMGSYNYEMILPLMCYCLYYGRGTTIEREVAARTILKETRLAEAEGNQSEEKLALLRYLTAEVYDNGSGGVAKDKVKGKAYREKARSYEDFGRFLDEMEWSKSPEGVGDRLVWRFLGRTKDTRTVLTDAQDIRSWQEARIASERQQGRKQAWRLCVMLPNGGDASFVNYGQAEISKALEFLSQGVYRRVMLDQPEGDDYLLAEHEEETFFFYANAEGIRYSREEKALTIAVRCFEHWYRGEGIDAAKWQEDEQGTRRNTWREIMHRANSCAENGDEEGRLAALREAAQLECGRAMVALGEDCAARGDFDGAVSWYQKATVTEDEDDRLNAWYWLGKLYMEKPQEYGLEARYYLEKAADGGVSWALVQLGNCALSGIGMAANQEKAIAYYEQGMAAGDPEAMIARAALCQDEEGNWQDAHTAMSCLEKAVAEKSGWQNDARLMLANVLLQTGSEAEQKKAEYLLQDAADEGCDEAQLQLAYREKARGNNAAYWENLRKAASEGNQKAKADIESMYVDTAWSENL
ncbi:hypothetical protein SAMN02910356_00542 [Selenomonas sp. GACV-9]|uniref:tetratricopeptide repeat protein n=1 Tax=Selenomonas sp. GACV-9 TaxID=3158782 RepID=UPI0008E6238E|nr:hypothetical protein SAMN02910356_00542 [Selenomonas ruminantium]